MRVLFLSIVQGHPKLSLIVVNLPYYPSIPINDHQGDHVVEVLEAVEG